MTVVLGDADVRAAFDWATAIDALRAAYAAPATAAQFPNRTMARGDGHWLRTLSGSGVGGFMGAKLIAAALNKRQASYLIPLFDQDTAELVALLDGGAVTGYRTAATSALAADLLADPGSLSVGVVGSGFEAQHHVRALAAVRDLDRVTVFSPNPESRARFVELLSDLPTTLGSAGSALEVVEAADLVVCAARSRDETPVMRGSWLRPGQTVVSIGSTLPEQREVDADTIARADLLVADQPEEVLTDTGDLLAAAEAGVVAEAVALADVVRGAAGRATPEQIVVYKSVGAAVQDLAVAGLCARRAIELGLGRPLPVAIDPVSK